MIPLLRPSILSARAILTSPIRRLRVEQMAAQSRAPMSVLFYHRVADDHPNDWTISRKQFKRHIEYCRENFELIGLDEVQRRVRDADSYVPAVSVTFDDGYFENHDFAVPLLVQQNVPCTYFVSIGNVRHNIPFQHDVQHGKPLAVNTVAQLREMSDAGIDVGCHTRNHVDFHRVVDPQIVRSEIVDAKDELEQIIGKRVRYFAFPFGMPRQLTQIAIEAVHEAGFHGFCSAYGSYNLVGQDAFHIRRCHGDSEFSRLKNWLSFDPQKVRREPCVRYFLPPETSFQQTKSQRSISNDPSERVTTDAL